MTQSEPTRRFVSKLSPAICVFLAVVGFMHIGLTTWQCHQIATAARELLHHDEPATVELPMKGGLTILPPLATGVQVSTSGGDEPHVSINYLASDRPPLLPTAIGGQYLLGGLLLVLAFAVRWLQRRHSRLRDTAALLASAAGILLAAILVVLTLT